VTKPSGKNFYHTWRAYEEDTEISEKGFYLLFYANQIPNFSSSWSAYSTITKNPSGLTEVSFNILLDAKEIR